MVWLHSFSCLLILGVNHQEDASLLSGWGVFLTSFPMRGNKLLGRVLSWDDMKHTYFVIAVQSLSRVQLFVTLWTVARQASLSLNISQSLLKLMSIESVMLSNHLILCRPYSCLQSYAASGSFPMSRLVTSGGQSVGVSASGSVLPMNIQCWFPLGLTALISLLSKGLLRVFSSTTVQNFSGWTLTNSYPTELNHEEGWTPKNWCFGTVCWRRLLRVPWTAKNQTSQS